MSRLFLVRHGPTHAKTMVGWSDLPADLSDHAALARLEAALPADALVVSSDLIRARSTADAIQARRKRLPHSADLREIHFGAWEMQRFDDVDDQDHIRRFWEEPGDIAAPGGESWNIFAARTNDAIDALRHAHSGQDLVIVAHFGVIITQIQRALGLSAYDAFGHKIDNLSLTEIHTTPNWAAPRINHIL
ncbi:histidine phosphatase family protein [Cognatishimia sp. SS12]|uniref:histidine phosphatase family protein n=1 Tax=Cognatishimia sp. SS12 TaxID=2979465 RepID=UPI00232E0889|nr:histidine phosphatase family protein [Cognatishimia sp. SS12]MDC0739011.1 histidine phosphatase family protein [Cognatishimia sp. SS12]